MNIVSVRRFATRSAFVLALGLGAGACDKAINVEPRNSVSSDTGFTTKEDAAAGLLGAYDATQSADYMGLAYPSLVDLIAGEIRFVGTFTTTYGVTAQNQVLPDNIQVGNTWSAIYTAIHRTNYLIQESEKISDPAFPKQSTIAQARALRAYHYMNLLALWGGTSEGYGYTGGLGVPLRLKPTVDIGPDTKPIARSSEAEVAAAIRADLDYAIDNLAVGTGNRITKNSAQALRARFELRMRNYADALRFANLVPVPAGFATAVPTGTTTPDAIWQLAFSSTDQNSYAFYWYPSPGGRNEFDPGAALAAAHPAGDKRLAVNVVTGGTNQKYTRTSTRDDPFNSIRYAEVALTIAEAAAQTNDLATATTQLNIIRSRAGLSPTTATTASALVADILLQRRLELAYEGMYWFDLRRTNRVQSVLGTVPPATPNAYNQSFRNLFPLPLREINLATDILVQNPGY
ncbi:RagB/SusD family nutrient uptake outer membrane protein [Hymenobacter rigui]|uniref:RagB/SusD family nutrient uptake outer membrane protein n=2 Tax=Hymenobacter rigui TaxID=334424 RepID=A0A428KMQ4_9BACT|nr:RagB/SusD family nutrient uptake outer membrane protein [Hymenobacter rigui]